MRAEFRKISSYRAYEMKTSVSYRPAAIFNLRCSSLKSLLTFVWGYLTCSRKEKFAQNNYLIFKTQNHVIGRVLEVTFSCLFLGI